MNVNLPPWSLGAFIALATGIIVLILLIVDELTLNRLAVAIIALACARLT